MPSPQSQTITVQKSGETSQIPSKIKNNYKSINSSSQQQSQSSSSSPSLSSSTQQHNNLHTVPNAVAATAPNAARNFISPSSSSLSSTLPPPSHHTHKQQPSSSTTSTTTSNSNTDTATHIPQQPISSNSAVKHTQPQQHQRGREKLAQNADTPKSVTQQVNGANKYSELVYSCGEIFRLRQLFLDFDRLFKF